MNAPSFIAEGKGPPILDLGDLRLRPLQPGDEAALLSYLSDPRVVEHTSIPAVTLESLSDFVRRDISNYASGTSCRWALVERNDQLIGICGFNNWSFVHEHAELAYDLAPQCWRRGYMRRAVGAVLRWGFETGLNRVHAFVMTSNTPSIGLLEQLGFHREGTLRQYRLARGNPRDFHLYALLRHDFDHGGESSNHASSGRLPSFQL